MLAAVFRQRRLWPFSSAVGSGGLYAAGAEDWQTSTPVAEGVDPDLVAELYFEAAELETLYGLPVVKNDKLIAEDYFNEGSIEQKALVQSVTKSITSALLGIALDQGCLSSTEQKMFAFFPNIPAK